MAHHDVLRAADVAHLNIVLRLIDRQLQQNVRRLSLEQHAQGCPLQREDNRGHAVPPQIFCVGNAMHASCTAAEVMKLCRCAARENYKRPPRLLDEAMAATHDRGQGPGGGDLRAGASPFRTGSWGTEGCPQNRPRQPAAPATPTLSFLRLLGLQPDDVPT